MVVPVVVNGPGDDGEVGFGRGEEIRSEGQGELRTDVIPLGEDRPQGVLETSDGCGMCRALECDLDELSLDELHACIRGECASADQPFVLVMGPALRPDGHGYLVGDGP